MEHPAGTKPANSAGGLSWFAPGLACCSRTHVYKNEAVTLGFQGYICTWDQSTVCSVLEVQRSHKNETQDQSYGKVIGPKFIYPNNLSLSYDAWVLEILTKTRRGKMKKGLI